MNDRFFAAVQREFAPGGTSTVGGAVVPAPDAINKMGAGCDVAAETAFLTKVLLPNTGIRVLIGKPCPGTTNDVLWRRIASYPCCGDPSDGIAPMLFTLGGDPSEHPTNLVGAWLKFSPDNFRGGFYMGEAACKASRDQKNMPILFLKGPEPLAPWCEQVYQGFINGTGTCFEHWNYIAAVASASDWSYEAGKAAMSMALVQNPSILAVATCADALAAGATDFWVDFNNGLFAAGLFVASFGGDPLYANEVNTGKIQITIDPMISIEGAGVVRAVKFSSIAMLNNEVSTSQDLVTSPVWPLGKYLKTKLKQTVLEVYDATLRPTDGGAPDVFDLQAEFTSISNVVFAARTFEAAGWITMKWSDKRAMWNPAVYGMFPGKMNWEVSEIYRPEFLWPNRIQNMLPNAAQAIESNGKGDFFYLTEFRGKFTCPMSLDAFPTDVQECAVKIITRLPAEQIVLSALRGIRCGPDNTGQYNLKYSNVSKVLLYNQPQDPHTQVNFNIYLERSFSPFLNTVVIPCIMLFVVGYSSLFLTAQPARAAFSIISLLSNLNVNKAGQEMTPVHVGQTWSDQWLMMHMCFAFIILIENVLSYHPKLQLPKPAPPPAPVTQEANLLMSVGVGEGANGTDEDNKAKAPPARSLMDRMRDFSKGPLFISSNYCDLVMQRLLPIVYFLSITIMLIRMAGNAQSVPAEAFKAPTQCVPTSTYENYIKSMLD